MRPARLLRSLHVQHPLYTLFIGASAVLLVVSIMLYPDAAFQASLQGLQVWWSIIFPALLPFLVLSHILSALGWVHALGVLLEPLMRILFRVPGVGGWAWALGWTAGYPAGAENIAKLRQEQVVSRAEGERLLALVHVSNPVFLVAVVGVGFMKQADVGLILACIHWLTALLTAVLIRIGDYRHETKHVTVLKTNRFSSTEDQPLTQTNNYSLPGRVFHAMEQARRDDGRPIGRLLGEAVTSAVQTLMMIGGYMMMFSVIIQVMHLALPSTIGNLLMNGLLEVNLGAFTISSSAFHSPIFQAALVSAVLAWGGISSHLQVQSVIKHTDMRYWRFFKARVLHAVLAFVFTYVCWNMMLTFFRDSNTALPVIANASPADIPTAATGSSSLSVLEQWETMFQTEWIWNTLWRSIQGTAPQLTLLHNWLQPLILAVFFSVALLVICLISICLRIWKQDS